MQSFRSFGPPCRKLQDFCWGYVQIFLYIQYIFAQNIKPYIFRLKDDMKLIFSGYFYDIKRNFSTKFQVTWKWSSSIFGDFQIFSYDDVITKFLLKFSQVPKLQKNFSCKKSSNIMYFAIVPYSFHVLKITKILFLSIFPSVLYSSDLADQATKKCWCQQKFARLFNIFQHFLKLHKELSLHAKFQLHSIYQ